MERQRTSDLTLLDEEPAVLPALRMETRSVHERLHRHPAFAALQAGSIARGDYTALLGRLHGFYKPLAHLFGSVAERVEWIEQDLTALSSGAAGLPRQTTLANRLDSEARRLGAEYVFEGSALGGQLLARGAQKLLGPHPSRGYRFFHGHGAETAQRWKRLKARLDDAELRGLGTAEIASGARLTFLAFEDWLAG